MQVLTRIIRIYLTFSMKFQINVSFIKNGFIYLRKGTLTSDRSGKGAITKCFVRDGQTNDKLKPLPIKKGKIPESPHYHHR